MRILWPLFLLTLIGCESLRPKTFEDIKAEEHAVTDRNARELGKELHAKWADKSYWLKPNRNATCGYDSTELKPFAEVRLLSVNVDAGAGYIPEFIFTYRVSYNNREVEIKYRLAGEPWSDEKFADCFYSFNPKKKYKMSASDWKLIERGSARIGFRKEQVILSMGNPSDVNRTVTNSGVHEQWVYGNTYLYFENDRLRSWQN